MATEEAATFRSPSPSLCSVRTVGFDSDIYLEGSLEDEPDQLRFPLDSCRDDPVAQAVHTITNLALQVHRVSPSEGHLHAAMEVLCGETWEVVLEPLIWAAAATDMSHPVLDWLQDACKAVPTGETFPVGPHHLTAPVAIRAVWQQPRMV